jgi:hypothetical protein
MEQTDQMRSGSELLAQRVMERVLDLVVESLDVNELVRQVDVNALLSRVDVNTLLSRVDVNALLSRVDVDALLSQVDVNALAQRVDIDAIVEHTDVGAVMAMSSGHLTGRAVDILRGQGVALDGRIDRLVRRLLRRGDPGLAAPRALIGSGAGT